MAEIDGVIKFNLQFSKGPVVPLEKIWELNSWRKILWLNGLSGQDPARYEGVGFGNISRRWNPLTQFIISGTQTGHLPDLSPDHYTRVENWDISKNTLMAEGPVAPSSEALTHAMIYNLDSNMTCVMHVHSPHIWRKASPLKIPLTAPSAQYGTPEMANEVKRLFDSGTVRDLKIFAMGGHEDGMVCFGETISAAGILLLNYLVRAHGAGVPTSLDL